MIRVGFIGLGNMGGPMAANLVKAGHAVRGFDPAEAALAAAAKAGVRACPSSAEAATGAEMVVTMLPGGKHLLDVYRDGGLLAATEAGTLLIDCSTCDVGSARTAERLAAEAGKSFLDAPVSGGVGGAAAASLTFMVGGEAAALERARPLLAAMGQRIVHCGQAGTGQAAKICNNMILGVSMIAVCEAFALAERLGLSDQALFDVASTSSGQCWSLTSYCPAPGPVPTSPANRGYRPGFATALMLKDLRLAQSAAQEVAAPTPLGAHAAQLYALFDHLGHGGDDFSGIIGMLRGAPPRP